MPTAASPKRNLWPRAPPCFPTSTQQVFGHLPQPRCTRRTSVSSQDHWHLPPAEITSLPPTPSPLLLRGREGLPGAAWPRHRRCSCSESLDGHRQSRNSPSAPPVAAYLPWGRREGGREGGGDAPPKPLRTCWVPRGSRYRPAGTAPGCPARQGKDADGEWQGWGCLRAERPRRGPLGFPAKAGRSSPAARAWLLLAWQLEGRAKRRERWGACACMGGCEPPTPAFPRVGGKKKKKEIRN